MRSETEKVIENMVRQIQDEFDRSISLCRFLPELVNSKPPLFWTDFSGSYKQTQRNRYVDYTAMLTVKKNLQFQLTDLFKRVFSDSASSRFLFSADMINDQLCMRLRFSLLYSWKAHDFFVHELTDNLCKIKRAQQRTHVSRKGNVLSPKMLKVEALTSPSEAGLSDINIITPSTT